MVFITDCQRAWELHWIISLAVGIVRSAHSSQLKLRFWSRGSRSLVGKPDQQDSGDEQFRVDSDNLLPWVWIANMHVGFMTYSKGDKMSKDCTGQGTYKFGWKRNYVVSPSLSLIIWALLLLTNQYEIGFLWKTRIAEEIFQLFI